MKNAVFWDLAPCRSRVNQRFGGTYRLHLQCRKFRERGTSLSRWLQTELSLQSPAHIGSSRSDFSTQKMEAIYSSETSIHTRSTRLHLLENGIHQIQLSFGYLYFYVVRYRTWRERILIRMDDSPSIGICGSNVTRDILKPLWHNYFATGTWTGATLPHTSRDVQLLQDEVHFTG
jgi:hypothetical protein